MPDQFNRRDFLKACSLVPLAAMPWPTFRDAESRGGPNVLILVFDTLSAVHTTLGGYPRTTTPNLERFASRATVYHRCYSGGNFTSPGTASLLTGTYPWSHRAFHLHSVVSEEFSSRNIFNALPDDVHRVAYTHNLLVSALLHQFRGEIQEWKATRELCLFDGQYSDLLFSSDYNASFWGESLALQTADVPPSSLYFSAVNRALRFANKRRIGARYGDLFPRGVPNLHDLFFILEDAIDWIADRVKSMPKPFMAYFHLLPPHEPYFTRRDFVDRFKDSWKPEPKPTGPFDKGVPYRRLLEERRKYDEYLAYTDAEFGRLLDHLERSGTLENTYVVLTSDHGELFERGIRGHITPALYEPVIRVPLIISRPGENRRRDVVEPVSTIDLLPTMLHWFGEPAPDWCEGELLPGFGPPADPSSREIFAVEAKSNPKRAPLEKASVALIHGRHKLVSYQGSGSETPRYELYDVGDDAEERNELSSSHPPLFKEMKGRLRHKLRDVNAPYTD